MVFEDRFGLLGNNVVILALSQAVGFSGVPMALLVGGIIGSELAPSPTLATLPIAAVIIGIAVFTLPASRIMEVLGRRRGFVLAAMVASLASLGASWAISLDSFLGLCATLFVMGTSTAFVLQYRFAAAESVPPELVGRAVSFILIGGILAGLAGPEIGRVGSDLLPQGTYTGSFAIMAVLYALTAGLLMFYREPPAGAEKETGPRRPLLTVMRQPLFILAVSSSTVAYGVMAFVMSATPISMHVLDGFDLGATTLVIQAHILGMYAPSLISGALVDFFGLRRLQVAGTVVTGVGVTIAAAGHGFLNYILGLVLLGLGWNFLFVAGTVMLTKSYYPGERFKVQGVNDLIIFSTQAAVTLSAGATLAFWGWEFMNLISLPVLGILLALIMVTKY